MTFIGIDPGSKGGISIINSFGVESCPYSNEWLITLCSGLTNAFCVVELVHSRPGDGKKQAFSFGKNYGYILGVLESFNIPYQLVDPRKWKNFYHLSRDKQESINKCKELFPNISLLPTERCRVDSDGMAESLLICNYGREIYERKVR